MRILNSAQMREADRRCTGDIGIASIVLMENAGRQVVAAMEAMFSDLAPRKIVVLCGRGNNGGDGFVVARTLAQRGVDVSVFLVGATDEVKGDARANLDVLVRLGHSVIEITDAAVWELQFPDIRSGDLLVDALFGTGLRTPLTGLYETIVADINASDLPVVSVDLPSGLSADTPDPDRPVHRRHPHRDARRAETAAACCRRARRIAATSSSPTSGFPRPPSRPSKDPHIELLTREPMRALIEPRPADSHKGDYGHVLIVAGSPGKTGAAHLSSMGALKSGAGLVTIATPRSCQASAGGDGAGIHDAWPR